MIFFEASERSRHCRPSSSVDVYPLKLEIVSPFPQPSSTCPAAFLTPTAVAVAVSAAGLAVISVKALAVVVFVVPPATTPPTT